MSNDRVFLSRAALDGMLNQSDAVYKPREIVRAVKMPFAFEICTMDEGGLVDVSKIVCGEAGDYVIVSEIYGILSAPEKAFEANFHKYSQRYPRRTRRGRPAAGAVPKKNNIQRDADEPARPEGETVGSVGL